MDINLREEGGYTIIELKGEIDLSTSPEARRQILACLEDGRNLLVDMSAVKYIDSSAVASLVEGYQIAKQQKLRFALVGVNKAVMSVLELARLDKIFPIHARVAEGITSQ